jgi:hypothetical protein
MIAKLPLTPEAYKIYKKELKNLQKTVCQLENEESQNEKNFLMDILLNEIRESKYAIKLNPNIRKKIKSVAIKNTEFYSLYINIISNLTKDYYYNN